MKHYLITRFNLKVEHWETAKDHLPVRTNEWLAHRFELFETYCLPSVINQKNQKFTWLIYFDTDTPIQFRNKINELFSNYSNYHPQFIDGIDSLNSAIKQFILTEIDGNDDFVITTRLDNDDAIHQNFVDTIQKLAIPQSGTVIDVRRGFQLNIEKAAYECRNYIKSFNPFISLIKHIDEFENVYSKQHQEWEQSEHIIIENKTPLWIEVVHNKNKMNRARINLPLRKAIDLSEFGISDEIISRSAFYVISYNLKLYFKKITQKISRVFSNKER